VYFFDRQADRAASVVLACVRRLVAASTECAVPRT